MEDLCNESIGELDSSLRWNDRLKRLVVLRHLIIITGILKSDGKIAFST